jgi:hypothetical protein
MEISQAIAHWRGAEAREVVPAMAVTIRRTIRSLELELETGTEH